jgi:leucyl-tRNA synthetase
VKWVNHFTDLDIATGQEAIDKTIDFAEKNKWGKVSLTLGYETGD